MLYLKNRVNHFEKLVYHKVLALIRNSPSSKSALWLDNGYVMGLRKYLVQVLSLCEDLARKGISTVYGAIRCIGLGKLWLAIKLWFLIKLEIKF